VRAATSPEVPVIEITGTAPSATEAARAASAVAAALIAHGNDAAADTDARLSLLAPVSRHATPVSPSPAVSLATGACAGTLSACFLCGCKGGKGPGKDGKKGSQVDASLLPMKYRDHNVILVSFDALQARHVSCLGYHRKTTPALDAFADECFRFTQAHSVASWTVPASMTWFTGVYPSEHRMVNKYAVYNAREKKPANLKELSPDLVTLAEVMKRNGYITGGFTGNAGVSGGFGYDQGFDIYFFEKEKFGSLDESVPKALEWLRANRGKKFFMFLHGYDVHGQNTPHDGFDYRFVEKGYDRRFTGSEQEQEALREEGLEKGQLTLRESDVRFWRAVYDEKINRADEKFRDFLAQFDKLGLSEKTLFVLTSDHGTEFYEHRRFDHGYSLYEEQIHVPLFIKLPGQGSGKAVTAHVSSIDVMPTVLDLLDVDIPDAARKQLRGASLVPAMEGAPVQRDVFSETDYREYTFKRSVIAPDGWKLICTLENRSRELYNLNDDPGETKNLAGVEPKRADEMERRLFAHFEAIGHDLNAREWKKGLNPVYPSQGK
jgi:arylsulfatase A-like enzyme